MADGYDALLAGGDAFCVEDLSEGVGLLSVVVEVGIGGFGAAAEAEEVGKDHGVRKVLEVWHGAGPHVGVVGEAVEEEEDWEGGGGGDLGGEVWGEVVAVC